MRIHPTALVDPQAKIAADVEIGPYTIIGPHVEIGPGCRIGSHTVITGHTRIGIGNRIYHHVSLGEAPQDKKYGGEPTWLEIGNHNTIREFCTFNRGTVQDAGVTRVGDHNWIMAYVHLAHDCRIGNHTVFANNAQLAGHVHVGDYAVLGGFTVVHQFCRIGAHAFVGGYSVITRDVLPYSMTVTPRESKLYGANKVGLERRGFPPESIQALHNAFRLLRSESLNTSQALEKIRQEVPATSEVAELVDFIRSSERGIIK